MKKKLQVKVTELGYYDLKRKKVGQVFTIKDESEFSWRWMTPVGWTPSKPMDPGYRKWVAQNRGKIFENAESEDSEMDDLAQSSSQEEVI